MEYKIEDSVMYTDGGKIVKGEIVGERGDYFIISRGFGEYVISKNNVVGHADSFEKGGFASVVEDMPDVDIINETVFYRYYPLDGDAFKISYDPSNKYGNGIYFLDNPDFYKGKFENERIMKVHPNIKSPLILTYHKMMTPSFEYSALVMDLIKKGEIKDKFGLTNKLIKSGFDSLVVYEPRGIYLVLLKEDESLINIISDLGVTDETEEMKAGGEIPKLDSDITIEISEIVAHDYKDIGGYQGEIMYRNFHEDLDSFFMPSKKDTDYVTDLVSKGYLQRDFEIVGEAFILTEKGKEFVTDVINALMWLK